MTSIPVDTGSPLTPLPQQMASGSREREMDREDEGVLTSDPTLANRIMDNLKKAFTEENETENGVYKRLLVECSNVERLTFFFENVAHHLSQLPEGYDRDKGELTTALAPPNRLVRAFPDRQAEERPSTRPSWRNSDSFVVPPEQEGERTTHQSKGKGRQGSRPVERMVEIHEEEEELDYLDEEEYEAQVPVKPITSIFGSDTPFKTKNDFFPARSPPAVTRSKATPGPNLPNPLQGQAAPSSGCLNDSVSQAKKKVTNWKDSAAGAENSGGDGGDDPDRTHTEKETLRKPVRHRGNFDARPNRNDDPGSPRPKGPSGSGGPSGPGGPPEGGDGGSRDIGILTHTWYFLGAALSLRPFSSGGSGARFRFGFGHDAGRSGRIENDSTKENKMVLHKKRR
ncbi:hypothetical protein DFH09DRAFT_1118429 [Mycena vulgaris]|nr:hypothetical protein DFH09DRAFT_1118429 [Mycena vulgaris]